MDTGGANCPPFASVGRDFPPSFAKLTSGRRHPKEPTQLWEEQDRRESKEGAITLGTYLT